MALICHLSRRYELLARPPKPAQNFLVVFFKFMIVALRAGGFVFRFPQ